MNKIIFITISTLLFACGNKKTEEVKEEPKKEVTNYVLPADFDLQGHRGARGLMPENTIEGFLEAVKIGVKTLEMDVVVCKDQKLVISHEPWFSSEFTTLPNLDLMLPIEEENYNIYEMQYAEIKLFDVGRRGNERFPKQKKFSTIKPLFSNAIQNIEKYCHEEGKPLVHYNIELKSQEEWDNWRNPAPSVFVKIFLSEIKALGIEQRVTAQSFDIRILQELKKQSPDLKLALLVENEQSPEQNLAALGFNPQVYSPDYKKLNAATVELIHKKGIKLIPWTVNDSLEMRKTIEMGVDGIITDFPDMALKVMKSYQK